jgi:replicative DNA helicase
MEVSEKLYSVELEESVLGGLIQHASDLPVVMSFLKPEDFFIVRHRYIYEAMLSLLRRGDPVHFTSVTDQLNSVGLLEEVGAAAGLLGLMDNTGSYLDTVGNARIVQRRAVRRKLVGVASRVAQVAHDTELELAEVVRLSEEALLAVTKEAVATVERFDLAGAGNRLNEKAEIALENPDVIFGVSTGMPRIDRMLGGLLPSLICILAHTSAGKSTLLRQWIAHQMFNGVQVFYFSAEQGPELVLDSLACLRANVPSPVYTTRRPGQTIDPQEVEAWRRAHSQAVLFDGDTLFAYGARAVDQIRAIVMRERTYEQAVVYIDTVNAMPEPQGKSDTERMSLKMYKMQAIFSDLDIPVVFTAQVKRESYGMIQIRDGKDSSDIENASRIILGLNPAWKVEANPADPYQTTLEILKHDVGGPGGGVDRIEDMLFEPRIPRFVDAAVERRTIPQPMLTDNNRRE